MNRIREKLSRDKVFNIFKFWVPLTVVLTMLTGLMYLLVQQDIRLGTNYPQIQIAEDIADQFSTSGNSADFSSLKTVEISQSLAPYAIIYSESGQPVKSSGLLFGQVPIVPGGILDFARAKGEDQVTWQPRKGVRQALVVLHFSGKNQSGFVVSGKSLRESEKLIDSLTLVAFTGWVGIVIAGLILIAAFQFIF